MPTTSLIPFPRYKRGDPQPLTHLFSRDAALFTRFLHTSYAQEYLAFDYDIKLGSTVITAIQYPTPENLLRAGTLAKRADAVGFITPTLLDLIEVKPSQVHAAAGQLLAYRSLFTLTYPHLTIRQLVLVTEQIDPDLIQFISDNHIITRIV